MNCWYWSIYLLLVSPDENAELWKGGKGMLILILWIYIFNENKFMCIFIVSKN